VILQLAHFDSYSYDGIGSPGVQDVSILVDKIPPIVMIALFIVISKGLFISSQTLRDARSVIEVPAA
jgi:hypothetical protein